MARLLGIWEVGARERTADPKEEPWLRQGDWVMESLSHDPESHLVSRSERTHVRSRPQFFKPECASRLKYRS